jgi:hypothetical protein
MPEARARLLTHVLLVLAATFSTAAAARAQAPDTPEGRREPANFLAANVPNSFRQQKDPAPQQQGQADPQNKSGYYQPTPLTPGEKMKGSLRSAFLSPSGYLTPAISATITHFREVEQPHKDSNDRAADFASRYARNFSNRAVRRIFSDGVYPVLFRQDPRYEPSPRKGFARRTLHAASRVFVTRDDDGNLEPNYSRLAGTMTGSALSNIWEQSTPGFDRVGADATVVRFGRSLAFDMLSNVVFREFWPDLMGIIRR